MQDNADTERIERGVEEVYKDIRESLELILRAEIPGQPEGIQAILLSLDDVIVNNWDDVMARYYAAVIDGSVE